MNLFKYSRKEAIKNNCYDKMALEPRKAFLIRCMMPVLILLLLFIFGAFYLPEFLVELFIENSFMQYIIIIAILIGYPTYYALTFVKNNNWFVTAFIKDENNEIWYIEQNDKSYDNERATDDGTYIKILNDYKENKKNLSGKAIKLENIKFLNETKKYYICSYKDEQGQVKELKILKAYENIKNILK